MGSGPRNWSEFLKTEGVVKTMITVLTRFILADHPVIFFTDIAAIDSGCQIESQIIFESWYMQ